MKKILFLVSFLAWHGNTFAGPVMPGDPVVQYIAGLIVLVLLGGAIVAKISLWREDKGGDQ